MVTVNETWNAIMKHALGHELLRSTIREHKAHGTSFYALQPVWNAIFSYFR
jgi:hypothetical protein